MPATDLSRVQSKYLRLSINEPDALVVAAKALASPLRLRILRATSLKPISVREIAETLGEPVSTISLNVRELETAGLLTAESVPGTHGVQKLCARRVDSMAIQLDPMEPNRNTPLQLSMPIGSYAAAEDITPTCGLAAAVGTIGEMDNPSSFYLPDRLSAELIWFKHGHLTYRFSLLRIQELDIDWLEISFEACSEAPLYRSPWKSDVDVSVNGRPLGVWTSPADFGGRRGLLTPAWWSDLSTQFGLLKTWHVDHRGTFLDDVWVSPTTLADLRLADHPSITLRVGVDADAKHVGGMNLFGKGFGDTPQDIVARVGYRVK